jgi:hypothetical protein
MTKFSLTRRGFLTGSMALLAAGCLESPIVMNFASAYKFAVGGLPDVPISRDQVGKIPYASISAKIGRGPRSLMILWRVAGNEQHWMSADRAVLVTRGGRVVKTAGFPENLKDTNMLGEDPLAEGLHQLEEKVTFSRTIDLIDLDRGHHYGSPIDSTLTPLGPRTITIVDIDFETILVREYNRAKTLTWNFTNYYWVDRFDGFVWKSLQHIARSFPPVEIEILKPAA